MSSIEQKELFEQYYQIEYDYNTSSLSAGDIADIKELVRVKRNDYGIDIAPLGTGIFDMIKKLNTDIRIEQVSFEAEKIDGMLYIPRTGKERAYVILNSNKPLVNQIFTAAHEYYHYIKDYQMFRERPYICDFSLLKNVNEKKACRFAAELLLPEDALRRDINQYCRTMGIADVRAMDFSDYAAFIMVMTVNYMMPLKAIIYRLDEENYIDNIENYIDNYDFIKKLLFEIKIVGKRVQELYSTENSYIIDYSKIYQYMEKAYITGNASKEDIISDARLLSLDMSIVEEFFEQDEEENIGDDNDDDELFSIINAKRG